MVQGGTVTQVAAQNNFAASVDPVVGNDSSQGYSVGSCWINTVSQNDFVCLSAAVGAAVWKSMTSGGSSTATALQSATTVVNVSAATAPTVGQALVATDSTHATWKSPVLFTNVLYVDPADPLADYTTIQAAITAAASGTLIMIGPGTYPELLTLKDGVHLSALGGPDPVGGVTVIPSPAANVSVLSTPSSGSCRIHGIRFNLSGGSGSCNILNNNSGFSITFEFCLLNLTFSAASGTFRTVNQSGSAQVTFVHCLVSMTDTLGNSTAATILASAGSVSLIDSIVTLSSGSSTYGAVYVNGGAVILDDTAVSGQGASARGINRVSGSVTYASACKVQGIPSATNDTDDGTATGYNKQYVVPFALTDGTNRVYKLPARALSADPASPVNGDIWYNSTTGVFTAYENGATVVLRSPAAHASTHLPGGSDALATAAPAAEVVGGSAVTGVAASFSRSDHVHALAAFGSASGTFCQGNDSRLSDSRNPLAHASTHLPGGADALATAAPAAEVVGGSAVTGVAASFSRSDHVHALAAFGSAAGTFCQGNDSRLAPAGAGRNVQYNNSGAWGGAAGLLIDANGYPIWQEYTNTDPTAPAAGDVMFSRNRAGQRRPGFRGVSGSARELGIALYDSHIALLSPIAGATVPIALGLNASANVTGTATARTPASTNMLTSLRRVGYVSATSTGSSAGWRNGVQEFWSGNAAGLGGFLFSCRFGIAAVQSPMRWFVGLYAGTGALSNANPSALTNFLGFGVESGGTTVNWYNNAASTTTTTNLGASFPATTANVVYEVRIFCAPNGTTIYYSIERLDSAAFTEGNVASNIPSNTTFLDPYIWINNSSVAAAVAMDLIQMSIETEF